MIYFVQIKIQQKNKKKNIVTYVAFWSNMKIWALKKINTNIYTPTQPCSFLIIFETS